MKKVLFIDRDGTLIKEPPEDFQVDSLEKLEFIPKIFRILYQIRQHLDFDLVIVTNQDGLGTELFPLTDFELPHEKMLTAFKNEGIEFDDILIDNSMPEENAPTRKPRTGLLKKYIEGKYDLANSYVIGDRLTDIELAKNIGCKAVYFFPEDEQLPSELDYFSETCALVTSDWERIYAFLALDERFAAIERNTKETQIKVQVNLDGTGDSHIETGLGFFDHMLEQIARHSGMDVSILVKGDLHVDEHHTIEDTALALGECIGKAIGNKRGMERYGFALPMDETLTQVVIDFGGRPWLVWEAEFRREKIGDMPTEMFYHFFKSFSDAAKCNLNIKVEGTNEHHKIEGIFKALARAIRMAIRRDPFNYELPSTKGML
jgi:imidazoleglycerol-phosphate dehydratase/histidinol-phosphatase